MKTPEEIIVEMKDIMPFNLPETIEPYIIEAMKLYAAEVMGEYIKNFSPDDPKHVILGISDYTKIEAVARALSSQIIPVVIGALDNEIKREVHVFERHQVNVEFNPLHKSKYHK